jgi:hypothetical protein
VRALTVICTLTAIIKFPNKGTPSRTVYTARMRILYYLGISQLVLNLFAHNVKIAALIKAT